MGGWSIIPSASQRYDGRRSAARGRGRRAVGGVRGVGAVTAPLPVGSGHASLADWERSSDGCCAGSPGQDQAQTELDGPPVGPPLPPGMAGPTRPPTPLFWAGLTPGPSREPGGPSAVRNGLGSMDVDLARSYASSIARSIATRSVRLRSRVTVELRPSLRIVIWTVVFGGPSSCCDILPSVDWRTAIPSTATKTSPRRIVPCAIASLQELPAAVPSKKTFPLVSTLKTAPIPETGRKYESLQRVCIHRISNLIRVQTCCSCFSLLLVNFHSHIVGTAQQNASEHPDNMNYM
jgi:hypothetical protein